MKRWGHLLPGVVLALLLPAATVADTPPYRIFMILWRGETEVEAGFRAYVRERGLPFELIVHDVGQDPARIPAAVAEARKQQPDLVYTWGTPVTLGVVGRYDEIDPERHITDIPVLFTMVAYPAAARLTPNPAASGRNLTGTTHTVPLEAQIKAIRAYRPLTRLAVLYNPAEPNSVINVAELQAAAASMDFELLEQPVPLDARGLPDPTSLPELIAVLARREPQFLYLGPDTFIGTHRHAITTAATAHNLPVFAATERPIRDGNALLGLVAPYFHLGQLTAYRAEQILLQRIPPAQIPVATLQRFTYLIKIPVAAALGLYPPIAVLNYAEVLE